MKGTITIIRRRQWHPTPVLLPGKSHGWRSLVGCSPWGHEELDMTERLHFHFSLLCIGEGNGNPLQCSCLENPRDGVAQSRTRLKWLSSSSSITIISLRQTWRACRPGHWYYSYHFLYCFNYMDAWNELPCPFPGNLPDLRIKPVSPTSPALQVDSLPMQSHLRSPK